MPFIRDTTPMCDGAPFSPFWGGLFIKEYNMEMDELDLLYKTRIVLREKGFVVLKEPVQEFYKNLFKFTGIGLGGLLNMAGKSAGQIAGIYAKEKGLI